MLARERTHTYRVNMNHPANLKKQRTTESWRDECAAKDIDDWKVGWIPHRSHFCAHGKMALSAVNDEGRVGTVLFDWLFYGIGSVEEANEQEANERKFTFHSELRDLHGADWPPNKPISVSVGCKVEVPLPEPPGACLGTASVTKTVQEWQTDPTATNFLTSKDDWESTNNEEKVVMIAFTPQVSTTTDALASSREKAAAAVKFNAYARFDSAKYIRTSIASGRKSTIGGVFRGVVPHLSYDPGKPEVNEVAEHIRDACDPNKRDSIFPPTGGPPKHIPGCHIEDLIHRITQVKDGWPIVGEHKKRYNKNGHQKTKNCKQCPRPPQEARARTAMSSRSRRPTRGRLEKSTRQPNSRERTVSGGRTNFR